MVMMMEIMGLCILTVQLRIVLRTVDGGDDYHFNSLRGSHFKSCTIFSDDFL